MLLTERTGMPMGFDRLNRDTIIGVNGWFEYGQPVSPKYWPTFKLIQENTKNLVQFLYKPMAISTDIIRKTFSPVVSYMGGPVMRDSIFQFHSFIRNLNLEGWLLVGFSVEMDSFILYTHTTKMPDF